MLLCVGMAAQAQQAITVKTCNGKDKYLLNKRVILDIRPQRPVVRTNELQTTYNQAETLVMYVSTPDESDADAIKAGKADNKNDGAVYDLSGRKVVNSKSLPLKSGIYIKDGKKVVL